MLLLKKNTFSSMSSIVLIIDTNFLGSVNSYSNLFTGCLSGYFGNKCKQSCSGHCWTNLVCDHIDGTCPVGCEAGYIGNLCNTSKIFHQPRFYIYVLVYSFPNVIYCQYFCSIYNLHGWVYVLQPKTDQIFICKKLYLHRHFLFNLQLAGMGIMAKTV